MSKGRGISMQEGHLHHIEIYVSDLKKSSEFWGWFLQELGYHSYQKWEKGESWRLGETYLVFVQTEERFLDEPYHRCRTGMNHLAFYAASRERVDEITEKLREKRAKVLYEDLHPFAGGENYYAVYFEDPDQIKVEFAAP
jgi:catechol 2,3-dioxygenase-like lactoylglutathione lyase family enzyme